MLGRWVVVAVLFSSVAQAEVPLEFHAILDSGTRVWLRALNAKGKQLWRREITRTDFLVFRGDIALLELDGTSAEGSAISESIPVSRDPSVLRGFVTVMPFGSLGVTYLAKPPANLVVAVEQADDVTGRGVVRVANQTGAEVEIINLSVHHEATWRAPGLMWPITSYEVKAGAEQTFDFEACSVPLSRGAWRRVVLMTQGPYLYTVVVAFDASALAWDDVPCAFGPICGG